MSARGGASKGEGPSSGGDADKAGSSLWMLLPRPVRSGYRRVVPRFIRVFLRNRSRTQWAALAAYMLLQWLFNRLQFGLVFFIVALMVAMFANLNWSSSRNEGQLSAYSVFNPGGTRLPGTYDAAEYDRMLRSGGTLLAK